MDYRKYTGVMVPATIEAAPRDGTLCRTLRQRQRSDKKALRRLADLSSMNKIPPSLEQEINVDPGGVLEKLGMVSATDFWRWFHAPDAPDGICQGHMGQKWGELWYEFLQTDDLVLAGAVPLVLHKQAQMMGADEDKTHKRIQVAEFKALQRLRHRLETLEPASIGGLVMTICGRVYINVQQSEFDLAMMHMQAMRRLIDMQPTEGAVWLCSVWTDLRVVSSTGSAPMLDRYISVDWKAQAPTLPPASVQECQRAAMSNMRSLGHAGSERFLLIYGIFRQLHELNITTIVPPDQGEPPIETLYTATYDCCVLDGDLSSTSRPDAVCIQTALLAICLKLCIWDKASRYIPRGGEIERNMLRKAKTLLGDDTSHVRHLTKVPGGANANAMIWMLLTLTATAYMFERDDLEGWIVRLRAVSSVSTASAFQRALKGWPSSPWWFSHAMRRICNELAPKKGQWRVLTDEPDPVPVFTTGLRLKLLVISN